MAGLMGLTQSHPVTSCCESSPLKYPHFSAASGRSLSSFHRSATHGQWVGTQVLPDGNMAPDHHPGT